MDPHEVAFEPPSRAYRDDAPERDGWDVDLARLLGCGILDFNHVIGNATVTWHDLQMALLLGSVTPASVWVSGAGLHASAWLDNGPGGKAWRIVASTPVAAAPELRFKSCFGGGR